MRRDNGPYRGDPSHRSFDAQFSSLEQRVYTIEKGFVDLRDTVQHQTAAITAKLETLGSQFNESRKPQWQPLLMLASVIVAFVTAIGTLAYWPILSGQSRADAAIASVQTELRVSIKESAASYLTRAEADWRAERSKEDRRRFEIALTKLIDGQVSRQEHEQRWQNEAQRFADVQRQIDEMKRQQGDTYTARDALLDARDRIARLERELGELSGKPAMRGP